MMCEFRTCFRLGKTLRYGDAESFLRVYDSLLSESSVSERQLESLKELARQISELSHEDFTLLQSACQGQLPTSSQFELGEESSGGGQLGDLLENLRQEVYFSDSGTVSDFDNSVCEDTRSRSNSFPGELEENDVPCIVQNPTHGDSERRPVNSTGELPGLLEVEEEAHRVKPSRGETESRHVTAQTENSKCQQELSAEPAKSRQSMDSLTSTAFQSCRSKPGTAVGCSDRRGDGTSYMKGRKGYSEDQRRSWKGRNKPHGKRPRRWYPQEQWEAATYCQSYYMLAPHPSTARPWDKQGRGEDAKLMRCSWGQGQTHKRSREGPRSRAQNHSKGSQTAASSSHLELAQFLWKGWVEVQKELQAARNNC